MAVTSASMAPANAASNPERVSRLGSQVKRMKLLNEVSPVIVMSAHARLLRMSRASSLPPTTAAATSVAGAGLISRMRIQTATPTTESGPDEQGPAPTEPGGEGNRDERGMKVPNCSRPTCTVDIRATRSGKYDFTNGGRTTLPMPMPSRASTLRARKSAGESMTERTPRPMVTMIIAATCQPEAGEASIEARGDEAAEPVEQRRQHADDRQERPR
jgi:hypothetical protein